MSQTSQPEFSFFGAQAYLGETNHLGSLKATEELAELCRASKGKYVLDIGCGVGITACYLAKKRGCRVVGVDISDRMIAWAQKRAKREGVEDSLEFRTADAQNLPFGDALFDAVISESVTVFLDKQRALSEYVRVAKQGGYVGLNEATWRRATPPTELVAYVDRTMAQAAFLTSNEWTNLLKASGLMDIRTRTYKFNAFSMWTGELRRVGLRDSVRTAGSLFSLYVASPGFRKYVKERTPSRKIIKCLFAYLGYGIYVGVK